MADLNKLADLQNVNVTANKTLAAADQGIVQDVNATGITITLPATAPGLVFYIRNKVRIGAGTLPVGAVQNKQLVTVRPQAADGFTGNGFTPAVNKAALNTAATSQVGDYIKVTGTGTAGVGAWIIEEASGIWAREA